MTDAVAIALITGITTTVGTVATAFLSAKNGRKIRQVHEEVKTSNNLKLGEMADDAESRRIGAIPAMDRTAAESAHIVTVPEKH